MWILLTILSAVFLACYDIAKKHSLNQNAVLPVLLLSTISGAVFIFPTYLFSKFSPDLVEGSIFFVSEISLETHLALFLKAFIVSASWILAYFALKHLPISLASPIRATAPFFTLIGAILIFGERPELIQWVGIILILISYYAFSILGKLEGISFYRSKWILYIMLATIIGACSALYDKYLIQNMNLAPVVVQFWFSQYLVIIQAIVVGIFWFPKRKKHTPFQWKWSIPCIGILLIIADFSYFSAIQEEEALISIISPIRRSNAFFALIIGGLFFKEMNKRKKVYAMTGVFIGILLIALA